MEAKPEVKTDKKKTNADKIWEEIKDVKVNMFTLPDQTVSMYCSPIAVEPTKLYLSFTVTSVLPALEFALGTSYKVEVVGRFIAVSKSE